MGMNVLSLFDGMSCGHLALDKAGVEVDAYVASEVKPFAIRHTRDRYPSTIEAGDVTALHYDGHKLYRDCKRWCVAGDLSILRPEDAERNAPLIKEEGGVTYIDIVHMEFPDTKKLKKEESDTSSQEELASESAIEEEPSACESEEGVEEVSEEGEESSPYDKLPNLSFDEKNRVLAKYKDAGLVLNAATLSEEELEIYRASGHEILPNGEIAKWENGEEIFEGSFDMLIGGSPCQDFSLASATNGGKYGLEGSKSRLFFDYLRLLQETHPRYFFLENVKMKEKSKKMLDEFLGVEGISINSSEFSTQNRPRIYWTNITSVAPTSMKSESDINFQNKMLRTLPHLEWALYVHKFPGSYFGYANGSPEKKKEDEFAASGKVHGKDGWGRFTFDDTLTDSTSKVVVVENGREVVSQREGTKEDIRRMVRFTANKYDASDKSLSQTTKHADLSAAFVPDLSFSDADAETIAAMNAWAREGYEASMMRHVTDREFVEEIHRQMYEALATKSPSRDGMRYGKVVEAKEEGKEDSNFSSCKDITRSNKMSCITRKQDRFPNSGNIAFGPYYRFVTKFEICEGQTVPYGFLGDLSYTDVQDVCGDGWTVDVIAAFFSMIEQDAGTRNETEETPMSGTKVKEVWDERELEKLEENKSVEANSFLDKMIPVRQALEIAESLGKANKEKYEFELRLNLDCFDIKKVPKKKFAPDYMVNAVKERVEKAMANGDMNDESVKEMVRWYMEM